MARIFVRRAGWIGGLALLLPVLLWLSFRVFYPRIIAKQGQTACFTLQMDKDKIYTHQNLKIEVIEGAVVLDDGAGDREVVAYTDFHAPYMTVCENYLAFFEYPETRFYLIHLPSATVQRVETAASVSGMKLSPKGYALAIADMVSTVYLYNSEGELQLTVKAESPICDASVSANGQRVGVLLFSGKTKDGFVADVFRTKQGTHWQSAQFTYDGLLSCHMQNGQMYLYDGGTPIGYIRDGKFHLLP